MPATLPPNTQSFAPSQTVRIPRLLYIYDVKDWSIHNVGKLWFGNMPFLATTFLADRDLTHEHLHRYDIICFGYLPMFLNAIERAYRHCCDITNWLVAIHDPAELFPARPDWKALTHRALAPHRRVEFRLVLRLLTNVGHVVTTSAELHAILSSYGLTPHLVPTCSTLPLRDPTSIRTTKSDLISVFDDLDRKNVPLLLETMRFCRDTLHLTADTKQGQVSLPQSQYIELLDNHEIYLCTSYQEGGPLPAMDAMSRGAVVITSPVGQVQDIIEDGVNGFICQNPSEFRSALAFLSSHPDILHAMRLRSLAAAEERSNTLSLADRIQSLTDDISHSTRPADGHCSPRFTRLDVAKLRLLRSAIAGARRLRHIHIRTHPERSASRQQTP